MKRSADAMLPEVLSGSLPDCDADSGPTPPTPPEVQALYEQIAGEARDTVGGRVPEANEDTSSNSSSSESESEHGSVMSRDCLLYTSPSPRDA